MERRVEIARQGCRRRAAFSNAEMAQSSASRRRAFGRLKAKLSLDLI
jgi:hypothetical protein